MPAPVRITFLGGLGEIGRNCMPSSSSRTRSCSSTAASCSPSSTCPGSTWSCPTSRSCARTPSASRAASPPTVTRTTSAGCRSCCASSRSRSTARPLTLGPGPQPHRGGRPARPHRAHPGQRRRAPPDREVRLRVHPRHPLGAPRIRHRVPHPQGTILHSGDFKLDLTPVDGRTTDLARIGAIAKDEGIRLLLADSTNAEEPGHSRSESGRGQGPLRPVPRPRGAPHHHRLLRQPHPPGPADRRRRHRLRAQGGHPGPVDAQERRASPARWACCTSPRTRSSTSRTSGTCPTRSSA
jgi:ribonuclease J